MVKNIPSHNVTVYFLYMLQGCSRYISLVFTVSAPPASSFPSRGRQ